MTIESDAKFEEKLTPDLENDMRNLAKFHQSTQKSRNWDFYGVLISRKRKWMSLKFTGELRLMIMKNDVKFEKELTCQFKTDKRKLTNFDPSTRKSKKFAL